MIDEKINKALTELEANLRNLESASNQVEKTVNSYSGLEKTTAKYVEHLGLVTTKIQEIVDSIGKDYALRISDFEKDRQTIIDSINKVSEESQKPLSRVQKKLVCCLIIICLLLVGVGFIIFLLLTIQK